MKSIQKIKESLKKNEFNIIIGCEFTGIVREAFIKVGFNAWSCDYSETEIPGNHYKGNIFDIITLDWDIGIFHPPCTRLANSGVRWLHERNLWKELEEASIFFKKILQVPISRIAVENPIPHKYALEIIGQKYNQIIQPWQFGHGETKSTCLWLKNLPHLTPTNIVDGRLQRIHKMSPSFDRGLQRSKTYLGIADAMAKQWSKFIITNYANN